MGTIKENWQASPVVDKNAHDGFGVGPGERLIIHASHDGAFVFFDVEEVMAERALAFVFALEDQLYQGQYSAASQYQLIDYEYEYNGLTGNMDLWIEFEAPISYVEIPAPEIFSYAVVLGPLVLLLFAFGAAGATASVLFVLEPDASRKNIFAVGAVVATAVGAESTAEKFIEAGSGPIKKGSLEKLIENATFLAFFAIAAYAYTQPKK
jgi:hypothetical protein